MSDLEYQVYGDVERRSKASAALDSVGSSKLLAVGVGAGIVAAYLLPFWILIIAAAGLGYLAFKR